MVANVRPSASLPTIPSARHSTDQIPVSRVVPNAATRSRAGADPWGVERWHRGRPLPGCPGDRSTRKAVVLTAVSRTGLSGSLPASGARARPAQPSTSSGVSGGASTSTSSLTPASLRRATSWGCGDSIATATRTSAGSRPASRHSSFSRAIRSRTASMLERLKPYQPSPIVATRRKAASLLPPNTTGTRRFRAGFGLTLTREKDTNSPANDATSSRHRTRIASRYSRARWPRRANGTPIASNSSRDQPTPIPSVSRPPHRTSRLATCLASSTGLCSGNSKTPVASPILRVLAAAKLSATSGSSQSASAGTAIRPSREYG